MRPSPASQDVVYEPENSMVHVEKRDVGVGLRLFLSNASSFDAKLQDAVEAWANDSAQVIISPHFKVSAALDFLIEFNQCPALGGKIDADAKNLFMSLREEYALEIARIDALEFVTLDNTKEKTQ